MDVGINDTGENVAALGVDGLVREILNLGLDLDNLTEAHPEVGPDDAVGRDQFSAAHDEIESLRLGRDLGIFGYERGAFHGE